MNSNCTHSLLPSFSLREFDFETKQDLMITWHSHEEVELVYIKSGNVFITVEDTTISASTGDYLFINQNVHHFYTPADRSLVVYCIKFLPSMLLGIARLELEKEYILPVTQNKHLEYVYLNASHSHYKIFDQHYQNLYQFSTQPNSHNDLNIIASSLQLWQILFELCVSSANKLSGKINVQDEQRVKEAILFIQEHYMESITLDDIADSIMVSKSECCRCFKRVMQATPFEYLLEYRILEATKRMKRKKQESISQIAGSVGFNNTSYFNKIFKKIMKCTPSEYRQSI